MKVFSKQKFSTSGVINRVGFTLLRNTFKPYVWSVWSCVIKSASISCGSTLIKDNFSLICL